MIKHFPSEIAQNPATAHNAISNESPVYSLPVEEHMLHTGPTVKLDVLGLHLCKYAAILGSLPNDVRWESGEFTVLEATDLYVASILN